MSSPRPRARQQTIARRCRVRDAPACCTGSGEPIGSILKHPKDGALSTHPASPPSPRASQLLRLGRASRHDCHALAAHPAHTNPANTRSPFPRQEHAPSQSTPPLELAPSIELAPSFRGEGFGPHTPSLCPSGTTNARHATQIMPQCTMYCASCCRELRQLDLQLPASTIQRSATAQRILSTATAATKSCASCEPPTTQLVSTDKQLS